MTAEKMSAKRKIDLHGQLQGIQYTVEKWNGKNPSGLVKTVHDMTLDALAVLNQPDESLQYMASILLMIKTSSQLEVRLIRGKRITRVTVLDQTVFNWGLECAHAFPDKPEKLK